MIREISKWMHSILKPKRITNAATIYTDKVRTQCVSAILYWCEYFVVERQITNYYSMCTFFLLFSFKRISLPLLATIFFNFYLFFIHRMYIRHHWAQYLCVCASKLVFYDVIWKVNGNQTKIRRNWNCYI